tara:strand:+ start:1839 stop:2114 length:276 start_codon:yes stop_codon:yes gene_type:complete
MDYIKQYQTLLSQAKNANVKFGTITVEEQKSLIACFTAQLEWWTDSKGAPEDISIEQFEEMSTEKKNTLLECLKIPEKWIVHSPMYNLKSI